MFPIVSTPMISSTIAQAHTLDRAVMPQTAPLASELDLLWKDEEFSMVNMFFVVARSMISVFYLLENACSLLLKLAYVIYPGGKTSRIVSFEERWRWRSNSAEIEISAYADDIRAASGTISLVKLSHHFLSQILVTSVQ